MPFESPDSLNADDREVVKDLRNRGFAVIIWTPGELEEGNMGADAMEDRSIEFGNEMIANQGG